MCCDHAERSVEVGRRRVDSIWSEFSGRSGTETWVGEGFEL